MRKANSDEKKISATAKMIEPNHNYRKAEGFLNVAFNIAMISSFFTLRVFRIVWNWEWFLVVSFFFSFLTANYLSKFLSKKILAEFKFSQLRRRSKIIFIFTSFFLGVTLTGLGCYIGPVKTKFYKCYTISKEISYPSRKDISPESKKYIVTIASVDKPNDPGPVYVDKQMYEKVIPRKTMVRVYVRISILGTEIVHKTELDR